MNWTLQDLYQTSQDVIASGDPRPLHSKAAQGYSALPSQEASMLLQMSSIPTLVAALPPPPATPCPCQPSPLPALHPDSPYPYG